MGQEKPVSLQYKKNACTDVYEIMFTSGGKNKLETQQEAQSIKYFFLFFFQKEARQWG